MEYFVCEDDNREGLDSPPSSQEVIENRYPDDRQTQFEVKPLTIEGDVLTETYAIKDPAGRFSIPFSGAIYNTDEEAIKDDLRRASRTAPKQ